VAKLDSYTVDLNLGPAKLGGKWTPDRTEAEAAWELYVELITRSSVVALQPHQGLLREALTSLYSLFGTTRQILKAKGPIVATPKKGSDYSFGYLAVTILNFAVRPFLDKWHPELEHWEAGKDTEMSAREHEQKWSRNSELRSDLAQLNSLLRAYADLLAQVSGVPNLLNE
jgi:hypothetical protein